MFCVYAFACVCHPSRCLKVVRKPIWPQAPKSPWLYYSLITGFSRWGEVAAGLLWTLKCSFHIGRMYLMAVITWMSLKLGWNAIFRRGTSSDCLVRKSNNWTWTLYDHTNDRQWFDQLPSVVRLLCMFLKQLCFVCTQISNSRGLEVFSGQLLSSVLGRMRNTCFPSD